MFKKLFKKVISTSHSDFIPFKEIKDTNTYKHCIKTNFIKSLNETHKIPPYYFLKILYPTNTPTRPIF